MTEIITQFNDYSGIIRCGSGYGDCSRVDRDRLIALLQKLPAGDVIVSTAPHTKGWAVIIKQDNQEPVWHILTPTEPDKQKPSLYQSLLRKVKR